jgi:hypothetical protein
MKAYMGSGFTPLVVQRNKALYSDIAERLTKQAQFYLNAQGQGEERRLIMIFVMTLSRIVCYLFPMGCFLGCLLSLLYKDFCIIIMFIHAKTKPYLRFERRLYL